MTQRKSDPDGIQLLVLEGAVDHRDYALTEREKAEGRVMHTCVSRSLSDRLVLDL